MNKMLLQALFVCLLLIFIGCKKPACEEMRSVPIMSVQCPSKAKRNQVTKITLTYALSQPCGGFGSIKVMKKGMTREIEIWAHYWECHCNYPAEAQTTTYDFIADVPGIYQLKFFQEKDQFLVYKIIVE